MPAELVVARVTARAAARSALVWGGVFALYLAVSALGYASTYKTAAEREALAAGLGSNAGVSALFGPARGIDTVAGFTEWRAVGVLGLIAAVWGLLAGTRLLRGEEDAGRWELLLAGRTTRRRACAEALAGLAAGFLLLWAVPAVVVVLAGRSARVHFGVGGSAALALASVASAAVFLLVGALAGQLAPTRRHAAAFAGAALAAAYAVRAIADAGSGTGWLRWLTPLGWPEQVRPLTGARPIALVPVLGTVVVLTLATVSVAGRRDLGASVLPDRSRAEPATRLLGSVTGLSLRLARPPAFGWAAATSLAGLLFGLVADSAARAVQGAPGVKAELARIGASGSGARAYLGVAFLVVAVLVALGGAAGVNALRGEEASGRLDHLLARPAGRVTWLLGRIAIAVVVAIICGLLAAVFAWVGARAEGASVGLGALARAGVNVLPSALVVLGAGVLVFGLRPRASAATCYALVAWSFLVLMVGSVVRANHWLLDTSLFRHMAAAPAVSPDWTSAAVLVGVAIACAAVGVTGFARRDLAGE